MFAALLHFIPCLFYLCFINVNAFQILEGNFLIFISLLATFPLFPSLSHWLEFLLLWFVHNPDMSSCRKVCTFKHLDVLAILESHTFFFWSVPKRLNMIIQFQVKGKVNIVFIPKVLYLHMPQSFSISLIWIH